MADKCGLDLDHPRHNPLSPEEERDLLAQIAAGAPGAREEFINRNVRFVVALAYHFRDRGLPLADLTQEGMMGLMMALQHYRPGENRFVTYALWWSRQYIFRALAGAPVITTPTPTEFRTRERRAAARRQEGKKEVAEAIEARLATDWATYSTQSLDSLRGSGWDAAAPEVPQEAFLHSRAHKNRAAQLLAILGPREQQIIGDSVGLRDGYPRTDQQIADILHVSHQAVCMARKKALAKLRREASGSPPGDPSPTLPDPIIPQTKEAA